jgi:hypothetical protein
MWADHALAATPAVGARRRSCKLRGLSPSGSAPAATDNGRQSRTAQLTRRSLVLGRGCRARVACSASPPGPVPQEAVDWVCRCRSRTACTPVDLKMQRARRGPARKGQPPYCVRHAMHQEAPAAQASPQSARQGMSQYGRSLLHSHPDHCRRLTPFLSWKALASGASGGWISRPAPHVPRHSCHR